MKKLIYCFIVVICFGIIGCKTEKSQDTTSVIQNEIELSVEPGEYWQQKMKVFVFSINNPPQMAAWIEDDNGNYVSTITVTSRSAKKNWRSAPKDGRPEALPVWNYAVQNNASKDSIDAVSSASSKEKVEASVTGDSLINGSEYNVYLEINHSFDYNEFWTEDNSGVNGQPSLIYHAKFTAGKPDKIDLVPVGHGSVDGSDGEITLGLEGFTTALEMMKSAQLIVK